jgi:hypothetical protein
MGSGPHVTRNLDLVADHILCLGIIVMLLNISSLLVRLQWLHLPWWECLKIRRRFIWVSNKEVELFLYLQL